MKNTLYSIIRLFIQVTMLFSVILMLPEKSEGFGNIAMKSAPAKNINTNSESSSYKFAPAKSIFISARTKSNKNISY